MATKRMILEVQPDTEESIKKNCELSGLTPGQVIDRLASNYKTTDPGLASLIICDNILYTVQDQTEEEYNQTICEVVKMLLLSSKAEASSTAKLKELLEILEDKLCDDLRDKIQNNSFSTISSKIIQ